MAFEIFSRFTLRGRRWFFRLRASNGEILAQSEAYNDRRSAVQGVALIQLHASGASLLVLS